MDIVYSQNNVPIRLTVERWFHIVENHDDLAGYYDEILRTIEAPDLIVKGYQNALIAAVKIKNNLYLSVIYKEVSKSDGFVITAYFTSAIKKEAMVWQKER
ncbi:MAG: hypothetical protein Q7J72_03170 [Candidatus Omnitrophota bacterium]|nr:hypothetical protein [Candidatus Omnitrophota bacterium]